MKLGCGIIVRIHYLEASKASNERQYSSEGKPAHSGSLHNLEFHVYYAIATGLKPGIATLQSLNYYTRCKFHAPPTSGLGMAVASVPCSWPFYDSAPNISCGRL